MSTAVIRPCLACSRDNTRESTHCTGCGAELAAWARPATAVAAAREGLSGQARQRTTLVLGLALVAALAALLLKAGLAPPHATAGPTWSRPATVASWAAARMRKAGVAPRSLEAVEETRAGSARRLLVGRHPHRQPLPAVVAAAAGVLLAGRDMGERTSTHLYVIEREGGQGEDAVRIVVPVGDAALLARDRSEVARLLGLPPEEESVPPEPPADPAAPSPWMDAGAGSPGARTGAEPAEEVPEAGAPAPPPLVAHAEPMTSSAPEDEAPAEPAKTSPAPAAVAAPPAAAPSAPKPGKPVPAVRVQRGPGAPPPRKVAPGATDVVAMRLQLHPGARRPLLLKQVSLRSSGTANEIEDVDFVNLVLDVDRDGRRGSADRLIAGPEAFSDDDGSLIFAGLELPFGADGQPVSFLVTMDMGDESEGGTMQLTVPGADAAVVQEVTSGQTCPVTGTPLSGPQFEIEGNLEPDPEQERLDALAEAGPDAEDPNLKR